MKLLYTYLILLNCIAFIFFSYDKWQAKRNKQRISERNLFSLVFFGGTIGGLIGMYFFKHKNRKTSFLLVFYRIIILQVILFYVF